LFGSKIFITWGEHDVAENIVHLVLARLPGAPAGTRGISLFVAPKFLVNADGSLGARNDLVCASIEHKLGIHGSPTAVMSYGEKAGAIAYLVGEPYRGLEYMFTMMKHARLNVGLEGLAVSERAYQHAVAYARARIQGRPIGGAERAPIIHHPDIRRMLMEMKSRIEAMRALAYCTAASLDRAQHHPDAAERRRNQGRVDLLIPVVKGWCTENAITIASTGIQVHGGMGYIEEMGAAQYLRDARITTIYEGTTGIQALDLIGRKLARDKGVNASALMTDIAAEVTALSPANDADLSAIRSALQTGLSALQAATAWLLAHDDAEKRECAAGAVPYLKLMGVVAGAWQMARAARIAHEQSNVTANDAFLRGKIATARFYAEHVLPEAELYCREITLGGASALAMDDALF
jgi:hypothetical protein